MSEKEQITKEQAYSVMTFAESLYNFYNTGVWNPWSQNANLLRLQGQPLVTDYDKIVEALKDVQNNSTLLQSYSQFMNTFDTIYQKTLNWYKNILSFDLRFYCINAKGADCSSEEFKEDKRRVYKFFRNFDYKQDFRNSLGVVLKNGIYYGWFRDSYGTFNNDPIDISDNLTIKRNQKYTLQLLPQNFCKLTGKWNNGYLFDFDFSYFLDPTTDLHLYDPSFTKKFQEVYTDPKWHYNPSSQLNDRNGTYSTWAQLSPQDGMICIKFDGSDFNIIPPFSPLMKLAAHDDLIHKYQLEKDAASAWALLYGSIGTFDNAISGTKQNQTKFNPKVMGEFMNLVQNSLQNIMKTVALPLDDTHFGQFIDQNVNMESTGMENTASQGAYGSSLIYSTGKRNQAEVLNGIIADYNLIKPLYKQYEQILDYYVNRKTKKYKFKFILEGSIFPFEREYRRKEITELADRGIVLNESAWASAYGYEPQELESMMMEAKYGGLIDNLTMMVNRNTMKNGTTNSNPIGGQIKSQNDLSDGGAISRDY